MSIRRLSATLLGVLLPLFAQAQEESHTRAEVISGANDEIVQRIAGVRRKVDAPTSCTAPKGTLTLGQAVHPLLGDSGSCYQSGIWVDLWTFTAQGNTTIRATFSAENPSLGAFQDFSTGTILASSSDTCGGLVTSCSFDYRILTGGQYIFGFGAQMAENYNLTLSLVTGGGGGVNLYPYKPTGWSDKIVVSTTTGANVDSATLRSTDTLYVDWAVLNGGSAERPPVNRSANLYVDGVFKQYWMSSSPLPAGSYSYYEDYSIGSLAVGTHTLKIVADPDNEVSETSETDNEYTRTITVIAGGGGSGACTPSTTELCLNSGRFRVSVTWATTDGRSGQGQTIPLTSDTGHFWFFESANVELVVKVLDGRRVNGHYWVFFGALSNVHYTITVVDTQTGARRTYDNPQGTLASVADTEAF